MSIERNIIKCMICGQEFHGSVVLIHLDMSHNDNRLGLFSSYVEQTIHYKCTFCGVKIKDPVSMSNTFCLPSNLELEIIKHLESCPGYISEVIREGIGTENGKTDN